MSTDSRGAFVGESRRGRRYLLAAVVVRHRDSAAVRTQLRGQLRPGARRVHFVKESRSTREQFLQAMATMPLDTRTWVCQLDHGRDERHARDVCLGVLFDWAAEAGKAIDRLVIESRGTVEDHRDRAALATHREASLLEYGHATPRAEPLLWLPDALVWSVGAGGRWRDQLPLPWRSIVKIAP